MVALVTFAVLFVTAGIRATPGILIVPLEREFDWSRTVISAAIAINIAGPSESDLQKEGATNNGSQRWPIARERQHLDMRVPGFDDEPRSSTERGKE